MIAETIAQTTTVYKWTRPRMTTHSGYAWTPGRWSERLSGEGNLCGSGWFHAYECPLLAVLHDPVHGCFTYQPEAILWQAEAELPLKRDGYVMCGTTRMRLVQHIEPPTVTTEHRVRYAILCALAVYEEPGFVKWANEWLDGTDRSEATAKDTADKVTNDDFRPSEIMVRAAAKATTWTAVLAARATAETLIGAHRPVDRMTAEAAAVAASLAADELAYATGGAADLDLPTLARRAVNQDE